MDCMASANFKQQPKFKQNIPQYLFISDNSDLYVIPNDRREGIKGHTL